MRRSRLRCDTFGAKRQSSYIKTDMVHSMQGNLVTRTQYVNESHATFGTQRRERHFCVDCDWIHKNPFEYFPTPGCACCGMLIVLIGIFMIIGICASNVPGAEELVQATFTFTSRAASTFNWVGAVSFDPHFTLTFDWCQLKRVIVSENTVRSSGKKAICSNKHDDDILVCSRIHRRRRCSTAMGERWVFGSSVWYADQDDGARRHVCDRHLKGGQRHSALSHPGRAHVARLDRKRSVLRLVGI